MSSVPITANIAYTDGTNNGNTQISQINPTLWNGSGGQHYRSARIIWDGTQHVIILSVALTPGWPNSMVLDQDPGTANDAIGDYVESGTSNSAIVTAV